MPEAEINIFGEPHNRESFPMFGEGADIRSRLSRFGFDQVEATLESQGASAFPLAVTLYKDVDTAFKLAFDRVPEQEEKVRLYSTMFQIPENLIRANFQEFEKNALYVDQREVLRNAPRLREWLANPDNFARAKTDIRNLSQIESIMTSSHGSAGDVVDMWGKSQVNRVKSGFAGAEEMLSETFFEAANLLDPFDPVDRGPTEYLNRWHQKAMEVSQKALFD
jgi:hypothetical protein